MAKMLSQVGGGFMGRVRPLKRPILNKPRPVGAGMIGGAFGARRKIVGIPKSGIKGVVGGAAMMYGGVRRRKR